MIKGLLILRIAGIEFIGEKNIGSYREPPLQLNIPIMPTFNQMAKDPTAIISTTLEFHLEQYDFNNNIAIYKGEFNV